MAMAIGVRCPAPPPSPTFRASGGSFYAVESMLLQRCSVNSMFLCCQLSDHQVAPVVGIPLKKSRVFEFPDLCLSEASSEDELWAAARLRTRTFYNFKEEMFRSEDHKRYLSEHEFEALKERVAGKRTGFRRVSCINATLPVSLVVNISADLCASCKFTRNGDECVVVGTLDLNQCFSLPDEIVGMNPKGNEADIGRAYISNVCVAKEFHRNGLGYELITMSKKVAQEWGISDLYVHVAVDNAPAKKLYSKCGFALESDEPAWQARFLGRPRRVLLWTGISPLNQKP